MTNTLNLSTRLALTAIATGALCFGNALFAQNSNDAAANAAVGKSSGSRNENAPADKTGTGSGGVQYPITAQDREFMAAAAAANAHEIAMGKAGVKQGQSAEVKRLGKMMVTDHTTANSQLSDMAHRLGVRLDTSKAAPMHQMGGGTNFDQQWLSEMVQGHKRAIALFQAQARKGSSPQIQGYATTNLPILQRHLKLVQEAQKSVGTGAASGSGSSNSR